MNNKNLFIGLILICFSVCFSFFVDELIMFLKNNFKISVNLLAIVLSPVVAVYVSERLRIRNYREKKKDKILENLIAYRNKVDSEEFLGVLNSLILFFDNNKDKGFIRRSILCISKK